MTRLILIRHGETDYSLQKRYCGFSDPPLNDRGILQSRELALALRDIDVGKVYSSDLKRASESARIVFGQMEIKSLEALREMNLGIFEGLKHEEIIAKHTKIYRDWISDPVRVKVPDGESLLDVVSRVKGALSFIFSQSSSGTLAIVTHGGPIRIILLEALGLGLDKFWHINQDIGALNVIEYPNGSLPVVVRQNDTSHISEG